MTYFSYLFEAKGIQRYILDSGRLADEIGASDLISELCQSSGSDLLDDVLQSLSMRTNVARRAAGSFCILDKDSERLEDARALWRLAVGAKLPGLEFSDCPPAAALDEVSAVAAARKAMIPLRENSSAFLLPSGHPFVAFAARTGRIAVTKPSRTEEEKEESDLVNAPQKRRGKLLGRGGDMDRLALSFAPNEPGTRFLFPRHFEETEASLKNPCFPFVGNDRRVAVVHADISGLGEIYARVQRVAGSAEDLFNISTKIEEAVISAARNASTAVLATHAMREKDGRSFWRLFNYPKAQNGTDFSRTAVLPARPILLGGDDITIIARADVALTFAAKLLDEIERRTREAFASVDPKYGLTELTACAGIAVVPAGHPTSAASTMADGLCKLAKATAKAQKPYRSALGFAVVTSTIAEGYDLYRERELRTQDGVFLNHDAYFVSGPFDVGTSFGSIVDLALALSEVPGRGKLYETLGLRFDESPKAADRWERFWSYLEIEDCNAANKLRTALAGCLQKGVGSGSIPPLDTALPFLGDALELIDIGAVRVLRGIV